MLLQLSPTIVYDMSHNCGMIYPTIVYDMSHNCGMKCPTIVYVSLGTSVIFL
jgi:hypothetical protein